MYLFPQDMIKSLVSFLDHKRIVIRDRETEIKPSVCQDATLFSSETQSEQSTPLRLCAKNSA